MSTKNKSVVETTKEPKFTKEVLVNSKRFYNEQDIVSALLKDGVEYTVSSGNRFMGRADLENSSHRRL